VRLWPAVLRPSAAPFHVESDAVRRRRRVVVAGTALVGTAVLFALLRTDRDSFWFYPLGAALATTWVLGAVVSGPLHLGRLGERRDIGWPVALGAAAFAGFAGTAVLVRTVPALDDAVESVISRADAGVLALVLAVALVNGFAEEVFFRGALYSAFGQHHPVLWSTIAYVAVTAASLNVMLMLAAAVMGTLFALERLATRGILAPVVTHLVWSVLMIFFLPR